MFGGDTSFPFAKSRLEVEPEYGNRGPQTPAGLKRELQGRDMRWKDGDIIDMCIPKETECSRDGVYNSFR